MSNRKPTAASRQAHMEKNTIQYAAAEEALRTLRDVNKSFHSTITKFSKDDLRNYLNAIGSNEKKLRDISRYLYYRSHIYFRLVQFYSGMYDLRCRKVVPKYDPYNVLDNDTFLKNYIDSLKFLDSMNLHGALSSIFPVCYVEDVCYALFFHDDTGSFFYKLDPDYCKIDSIYATGDFGFSVDMSHWKSDTKQREIEWLGEPMVSMYREYASTGNKWVHCDDRYAACFKFRSESWETIVPPFLSLFLSLINLEDLADVQAIADAQQIYKLVYLPMETISGSKKSDDFEVSPDLMLKYFDRLVDEALPDYVSAAPIPGSKLDFIDFSDNAAKDTDRLEQSASTILNTSGGGMVLNTSKITTQAGFQAALACETEFAMSTLLPQINAFTNRMLIQQFGDRAAHVEHFEVSVYTKEKLYKSLMESCQYGFSNRLAVNTLLGISEMETMAMQHLEENVLKLPDLMSRPLSSSHTQSANDVGRPLSDDDELSDAGSESRKTI